MYVFFLWQVGKKNQKTGMRIIISECMSVPVSYLVQVYIHVCICRYFLGNREVRDYLIMKWDRAKFSNEIFLLVVYCGYVG